MLFWVLILLLMTATQSIDEKIESSIRSVKCSINENFVFQNFSCFAKSYSRTFSTTNVKVYFKEPLNTFFVKLTQRLMTIWAWNLIPRFSDSCRGYVQVWNHLPRGFPNKKEGMVWQCKDGNVNWSRTSSNLEIFQVRESSNCTRMSLYRIFDAKLHIPSKSHGKYLPDRRLQAALHVLEYRWRLDI